MKSTIIDNLNKRFGAYTDLVEEASEDLIQKRIDVPKHKTLGEHLWCVIGARESYAKALREGQWSGFSNSMTKFSRADFEGKLRSSAREVLDAAASVDTWTPEREELLLTLYEHEVMHEGQIIRHMYGLGRTLPKSWRWA